MMPLRRPMKLLACMFVLAALCALQSTVAAADSRADAPKAPAPAPAPGAGGAAHVLVITASDPYLPAFVEIDGAMRAAVVQRHQRSVVWLYESIDTIRLGGAAGQELAEVLARKYENVRIDAVVLVLEPAVDFHLGYGHRLWPNAAAVYHFVLPRYASELPPGARLSGLPVDIDFAGTLRTAFALQPNARRMVVVGGVSPFDEAQLEGARAALLPYRGRVDAEFLVGLSPRAAAERLAGETLDTIVLYTSLFRDAGGQVYLPREALATLSAASGAPIYGVFETYMGYGLAAGAIELFKERGERIADLVVRALNGEFASGPATEQPLASRCLADGRQLARYRLSAAALPAGCEVRYVEASFLQRYWWQSLLALLALIAQSALIFSLLLQRSRRHAAELGLAAQRVEFLHASRLAVAGELTASIAHEINQPLGAILSNADAAEMLLESGRVNREELLQILADIKRDDLRASEIIKRMRAMLSRRDIERCRFSLNEVVEQTATVLRSEASRRGITVDYELRARHADILGDPVQIQQAIINLMLNAFDATTGGPPQDACRVRVETSDTPGGVKLSVRDFGAGIAPANLARVFDSFFSTKRDGMGLGLPITRSIVEAHGGMIDATSCEVGAEFRIILPMAPVARGPDQPMSSAQ